MKHGTSRRDFVKTAVAASVAGATLPAQAAIPAGDAAPSSAHASNQVHAAEPIAFPRIYTGRNLARISCPLGGIGAGGIGLGGRGNLQDWQIFNRPDIGNTPQFCFPSLWVRPGSSSPFSAILERRFLPPYDTGADGFGPGGVPGLPPPGRGPFPRLFPALPHRLRRSRLPSPNLSRSLFALFPPRRRRLRPSLRRSRLLPPQSRIQVSRSRHSLVHLQPHRPRQYPQERIPICPKPHWRPNVRSRSRARRSHARHDRPRRARARNFRRSSPSLARQLLVQSPAAFLVRLLRSNRLARPVLRAVNTRSFRLHPPNHPRPRHAFLPSLDRLALPQPHPKIHRLGGSEG